MILGRWFSLKNNEDYYHYLIMQTSDEYYIGFTYARGGNIHLNKVIRAVDNNVEEYMPEGEPYGSRQMIRIIFRYWSI